MFKSKFPNRRLMTMMRGGQFDGELHIYCHKTVRKGLEAIADLMLQKKFVKLIGERVLFHDIEDGMTARLCGYDVTFFDIGSTKLLQFGFTTTLHSGARLTCLGDEPYYPDCRRYVEGTDWLLCEAFCLNAHADRF